MEEGRKEGGEARKRGRRKEEGGRRKEEGGRRKEEGGRRRKYPTTPFTPQSSNTYSPKEGRRRGMVKR
jgi:hypothetical protein